MQLIVKTFMSNFMENDKWLWMLQSRNFDDIKKSIFRVQASENFVLWSLNEA